MNVSRHLVSVLLVALVVTPAYGMRCCRPKRVTPKPTEERHVADSFPPSGDRERRRLQKSARWNVEELILGHMGILRRNVEQGADVNARFKVSNITPLHMAMGSRKLEVPAFLLDLGADIEARDDYGRTPLHYAVKEYGAVCLLLARGAEVNAQSQMGTPLHSAACDGKERVIEKLLAVGADSLLVDAKHQMPLQGAAVCAAGIYRPELAMQGARALLEHGVGMTPDQDDCWSR